MFYFWFVAVGILLQIAKCSDVSLNDTDRLVYDKWLNIDKMLKGFVNSGLKNVLPAMMDFSSRVNLSSTCLTQGLKLLNGIKQLDTWAISFIDSSGKSIDGLLSSTTAALGDYNQCLQTVATRKVENEEVVMFEGKYCIVEIKPPLPAQKDEYFNHGIKDLMNITKSASGLMRLLASKAHGFYAASLQLGICIPSGCSLDDINQVVSSAASEGYMDARASYCEVGTEKPLSTGNIVAISAYSIIGFLAFIGTVLDLYFRKKNIQLHNKALSSILAFSFPKNTLALLRPEQAKNEISCLHGIRFLTVTWILTGHTVMFAARNPQLHHHMIELLEAVKSFGMQIVVNGTFSVDTFFLIGGLVNCYVTVKHEERNRSRSFLYSIKHRLWRILPIYVAAIFSFLLLGRMLRGPSEHTPVISHMERACYNVWWRNLIFINNYWPTEFSCLPHSWYLAAEFQLFVVSWGVIRILLRFPKMGLVLPILLVAFSVSFSITWTEVHGMHATFIMTDFNPQRVKAIEKWYCQTVVHAAPYFSGILVGYVLATKKDFKISKFTQCLGWLLSTTIALCVVFATKKWNNDVEPTKVEDILYSGFSKLGFSLSVAWVIICCAKGYGGVINSLLSWKFWVPLSRLTFCVYLISPVVLFPSLGSSTTLRESSTKEWVWRFFGDYFVSIFLAFLLYVLVENPFMTVEKIFETTSKSQRVEETDGKKDSHENADCIRIDPLTRNGTQKVDLENV